MTFYCENFTKIFYYTIDPALSSNVTSNWLPMVIMVDKKYDANKCSFFVLGNIMLVAVNFSTVFMLSCTTLTISALSFIAHYLNIS